MSNNAKKWLSVAEAAKKLEISEKTARNRLANKCPILFPISRKVLGRREVNGDKLAKYLIKTEKAGSCHSRPVPVKNDQARSGRGGDLYIQNPTSAQGGL